jgi:arsenate reductase
MAEKVIVYEKPTCTKCRQMTKLLTTVGFDFDRVNYYLEPFSESKLRSLLKKMKLTPKDLLRTSETAYRELGLAQRDLDDSELIMLMIQNPDLIQRPIVERGDRAILGRPTENVEALLK